MIKCRRLLTIYGLHLRLPNAIIIDGRCMMIDGGRYAAAAQPAPCQRNADALLFILAHFTTPFGGASKRFRPGADSRRSPRNDATTF